jgi:hypothetical protein
MASASFCDPPSIRGQPTWWDSIVSSIPSAEVSGWVRSSMPWAAAPPSSARASSVSKYRCASHRTLGSPLSPKWAICSGLRVGSRRSLLVRKKSTTSVPCSTSGPNSRR